MTTPVDTSRIARSYPAPAWALESRSFNEVAAHFAKANAARSNGGPSRPYESIVAVFRCIQFIACGVAHMPLMVSRADEQVIETGPIIDMLDAPSPGKTGEDFIIETIGWRLLSGRAHWIVTKRAGRMPTEIVVAGKPQMRPRYSRARELVGWKFRPAGMNWTDAIDIELEDVWTMTVPRFDADRPGEGLPILDVIRRAVNQLYKSDVANESSLDNGVEPGGALKTEQNLNEPQRLALRQFIDEHHAGVANRRRLLLLEGGLEFQAMQSAFKDMEFSTLKGFSRADACAGFGLDPAALGFPPTGGRFEYAKAAKDDGWISVVLPAASWLAGQIDRGLLGIFDGDRSLAMRDQMKSMRTRRSTRRDLLYRVRAPRTRRSGNLYTWFDTTVVDAVKELVASRVETASKMVRDLKETPQHAGEIMDLGLSDNAAQQQVWVTTQEVPWSEDGILDDAPTGDELLPEELPSVVPAGGDEAERAVLPDHLRALSEEQLAALHRSWWRSWESLRKSAEKAAARHFRELRKGVLDRLDASGLGVPEITQASLAIEVEDIALDGAYRVTGATRRSVQVPALTRNSIGEVLFSLSRANGSIVAKVGPLIRQAIQLGGEQTMQEAAAAEGLTTPDPFNLTNPAVEAAVRAREVQVTGINQTLRRRLASTIADGVAEGETTAQLAERVRREFNLAGSRASTIARMEIGGSVEKARQLGRDQADVPSKSWLWSRKETGRDNHFETETQTLKKPVANGQRFVIAQTHNPCDHPRDPALPADDAINCGCTTLSRYPGDQVRDARMFNHLIARGFAGLTRAARKD